MAAKKKTSFKKPARIVVYIEPDAKNASLLNLVVRLSRRKNADVLVLRVLRELPWYIRGSRAKQIREAVQRDATGALQQEVKPLVRAGLKVRTRVAWGRPFEVIIHEALRQPTQLVMKTAHGEGGGRFGSTAMQLFRNCPVPVWVVKPRRTTRIRRVLAAVDPVEPTPDEVDLNTEILQLAFDIATGESAELQICHAFWILSERVLPGESQAYVTEFVAKVKEAMTQLISPFELSLDDRRVHIVNGDPSKVIPPLAAKEKIDLLVMGTISRAGVAGLLIGNTAERMLQAVDCSVLVIKPERFVSPLTLKV